MKFIVAELPEGWPDVPADLIVLSEFLYFLSKTEIAELARLIVRSWIPGGDCIVVSFLERISTGLQGEESGRLMLEALRSLTNLKTMWAKSIDRYRIDVVRRL